MDTLPLVARILSIWRFLMPFVCYYNPYEFKHTSVLLCLENSFLHVITTPTFYNLPVSSCAKIPEPWGEICWNCYYMKRLKPGWRKDRDGITQGLHCCVLKHSEESWSIFLNIGINPSIFLNLIICEQCPFKYTLG